ncbi:MAG: DISARM system SNF2-like helicase DrmD [Bacillota bacterium]|nr:DISARM system SNF2-like helicase DrmD [Bacillota bacterium]
MIRSRLIREIAQIKMKELNHDPMVCLVKSDIDINPHQLEAFLRAISALKLGGIVLADEVGLGKTIEAGLAAKYLILNGATRLLFIMPANLRKQWQMELEEKFIISSLIVENTSLEEYDKYLRKDSCRAYICSYNFAANNKNLLHQTPWDAVIFDEAHKLRNVHKSNIKQAKRILELTRDVPKIMLTATPIQNNLYDLFGIMLFIDEKIFLDKRSFKQQYLKHKEFNRLKEQIKPVIQRTLRKDVADYLSFTNRNCITVDFSLSPKEAILYMLVSEYLKREILYAVPSSNRNLVTIVVRKLLASSSHAILQTFEVLRERLERLKESTRKESVEKSLDYFLDFLDEDSVNDEDPIDDHLELYDREKVNEFIQHEIDLVDNIILHASSIDRNSKAQALIKGLETAFTNQRESGIDEKAVVFTESVRTQAYLFSELSANGYENEIILFNGSMTDDYTKKIYRAWRSKNYGRALSSRSVEVKQAVVDYFKNEGKILLVTDAGSEGLNLQFCNTVVNYDLPWNPQKIEQRIGRCHRYGQKNDVVVINLLNTENAADKRVYEILANKLKVFEGMFGTSDEALGLLESGADFEKRVLQIYQQCNTIGEFSKAFKQLEKEFDRKRNEKLQELKSLLIDSDKNSDYQQYMQNAMQYMEDHGKWHKLTREKDEQTDLILAKMWIRFENIFDLKDDSTAKISNFSLTTPVI